MSVVLDSTYSKRNDEGEEYILGKGKNKSLGVAIAIPLDCNPEFCWIAIQSSAGSQLFHLDEQILAVWLNIPDFKKLLPKNRL
jgi:hypothetical protein